MEQPVLLDHKEKLDLLDHKEKLAQLDNKEQRVRPVLIINRVLFGRVKRVQLIINGVQLLTVMDYGLRFLEMEL
jgi:hypothetical protein